MRSKPSVALFKSSFSFSSMRGSKASQRRHIAESLADGSLHILVGTHAVIEDKVQFSRLGFVVPLAYNVGSDFLDNSFLCSCKFKGKALRVKIEFRKPGILCLNRLLFGRAHNAFCRHASPQRGRKPRPYVIRCGHTRRAPPAGPAPHFCAFAYHVERHKASTHLYRWQFVKVGVDKAAYGVCG